MQATLCVFICVCVCFLSVWGLITSFYLLGSKVTPHEECKAQSCLLWWPLSLPSSRSRLQSHLSCSSSLLSLISLLAFLIGNNSFHTSQLHYFLADKINIQGCVFREQDVFVFKVGQAPDSSPYVNIYFSILLLHIGIYFQAYLSHLGPRMGGGVYSLACFCILSIFTAHSDAINPLLRAQSVLLWD